MKKSAVLFVFVISSQKYWFNIILIILQISKKHAIESWFFSYEEMYNYC